MIKNLFDLTKKDFTKILDKEISIYEKLDMIYFKISVTRNGVFSLRRPRYLAISDIDCICNSVYKDIMTFTNDNIYPIKDRILEKFGELTIGVFYLPVHKTKMIDYDNVKVLSVPQDSEPEKMREYFVNFLKENSFGNNKIQDLIKAYKDFNVCKCVLSIC